MRRRLLILLTAAITLGAPLGAQEMTEVLRLDTLTDDRVTQSVVLHADGIDPNRSASSDRYSLTVDGREVDLPQTLLARLSHERRGYSYDAFTDGIRDETATISCMMAGPARGLVLSVLYLRYDNERLSGAEMRPVLSHAQNCLFLERIRPVSDEARAEANAAMAALRVISEITGR